MKRNRAVAFRAIDEDTVNEEEQSKKRKVEHPAIARRTNSEGFRMWLARGSHHGLRNGAVGERCGWGRVV